MIHPFTHMKQVMKEEEVEEEVVLEEIITIEGEVEDIFPIPLEDEEDEVIHK